jgi:hypothetical protein
MNKKLGAIFFSIFLFSGDVFTQGLRWERYADVKVAPVYSNRFLGSVTPFGGAKGYPSFTEQQLKDSFAASDMGYQTLSFSAGLVFKQTNSRIFSISVGLQQWGFTREKVNNMFNYQAHPDLAVYAQLSVGPTQRMLYQFRQRYIVADLQYMKRIDGLNLRIENSQLFFTASASPAFLIYDDVRIKTQGFSLEEGQSINVYDYTLEILPTDGVKVNRVNNIPFNAFVGLGMRLEYGLSEKLKLVVHPRFQMAILPNHQGVQTAWGAQGMLDLGLKYPLSSY